MVNPKVLREKEFEIRETDRPAKIMVVGVGIAGMEAARTLALRGYQVCLYEKSAHLGGQWRIAERPEIKADYKTLIPYLARRLKKADVRTILNIHVTFTFILNENPDIVLVANGAVPKAWIGDSPDRQVPIGCRQMMF
jgi:2-enoate reductase